MLAEIQGKIGRTGSNLTERLEDNLTGNVFGVLRYIPFSIGLGEVLTNGVYPESVGEEIRRIAVDFWADKIDFWPFDPEGEIDVLIEFETMIIGIEVKYKSGLSSDDEVTNNLLDNQSKDEVELSTNQLARESRIVSQKGQHKQKVLLFIADRNSCKEVYEDIVTRDILEKDVLFGYIPWQDILLQVKKLQISDPFHQVMIQDLTALLTRKGFEDFTTMQIETPEPINTDDFYQFTIQDKAKLSFQTNLTICEGLYYEFVR